MGGLYVPPGRLDTDADADPEPGTGSGGLRSGSLASRVARPGVSSERRRMGFVVTIFAPTMLQLVACICAMLRSFSAFSLIWLSMRSCSSGDSVIDMFG